MYQWQVGFILFHLFSVFIVSLSLHLHRVQLKKIHIGRQIVGNVCQTKVSNVSVALVMYVTLANTLARALALIRPFVHSLACRSYTSNIVILVAM